MKNIINRRIDAKGRLPPEADRTADLETDYQSYTFSTHELVMYFLSGGLFMAMVSWLFYDSVAGAICAALSQTLHRLSATSRKSGVRLRRW